MRSFIKRLSRRHGTAVAYLALFAALSGSAYAAATVTGQTIKDGTITGKDVKNRSLGKDKLSRTAVSSLTGPEGPQGPAGNRDPQGPAGPIGPKGPTGISGYQVVVTPVANATTITKGASDRVGVVCPDNKKVLGGGVAHYPENSIARVVESTPSDTGSGWTALVYND